MSKHSGDKNKSKKRKTLIVSKSAADIDNVFTEMYKMLGTEEKNSVTRMRSAGISKIAIVELLQELDAYFENYEKQMHVFLEDPDIDEEPDIEVKVQKHPQRKSRKLIPKIRSTNKVGINT